MGRILCQLQATGGAAAAACLLYAVGCGGPVFDGQVFRGNGMNFRVGPIPASWRRIDASDSLLAFRDDRARVTIAMNGRCGEDGDDVPLRSLTRHLFLHFTDRRVLEQTTLTISGRDALRTELVAELDGVAKHFTVYVLKKDGCVYDFLQIADRSSPDAGEGFETFVRGFATLG